MNVDNTQNIISFCSGYGGLELGIKRACPDVRTVAYVEIEAFAIANLVAKIEKGQMDAAPIWSNLKTFDGRPFRNRVHGIIGGYPCQPFSNAGKRLGTKDPRHLWPYIKKHIRTIEPVWCFFENVVGHLSEGFKEVVFSLQRMGYRVEAGLFTAAEVGASHKRARLFILAHSGGEGLQGYYESAKNNPQRRQGPDGYIAAEGSASRVWPAGPEQDQYCWERSRTIKSGVGCSIHGFNARVDQIRLLGNGVVPQTAELAFRTLWNKTI